MTDEWYCPTCESYVSWQSVTFEEVHELCGTYLGDKQGGSPARGIAYGLLFSVPIWCCIGTVVYLVLR